MFSVIDKKEIEFPCDLQQGTVRKRRGKRVCSPFSFPLSIIIHLSLNVKLYPCNFQFFLCGWAMNVFSYFSCSFVTIIGSLGRFITSYLFYFRRKFFFYSSRLYNKIHNGSVAVWLTGWVSWVAHTYTNTTNEFNLAAAEEVYQCLSQIFRVDFFALSFFLSSRLEL